MLPGDWKDERLAEVARHPAPVTSLALHPREREVASCAKDGTIQISRVERPSGGLRGDPDRLT